MGGRAPGAPPLDPPMINILDLGWIQEGRGINLPMRRPSTSMAQVAFFE